MADFIAREKTPAGEGASIFHPPAFPPRREVKSDRYQNQNDRSYDIKRRRSKNKARVVVRLKGRFQLGIDRIIMFGKLDARKSKKF